MQIIVEPKSEDEARELGVFDWEPSSHPGGRVDQNYSETLNCYVVSGQARIQTEDGSIEVESGDLLTIPKGLDCTWHVRSGISLRNSPVR